MINDGMVSVIIPTYNATSRLGDAIESVLNQTYRQFEIIVVDDNNPGSEGRAFTERVLKKYDAVGQVIYVKHNTNMNGAAARNTGIRIAKGQYIAFLDDDDIYYPERLQTCVSILRNNSNYSVVYTNVDLYKNDSFVETRKAEYSGCIWRELLLNEGVLGTGSNLFFERKCLENVVGFDENFLRYQDVEFMIRMVQKYPILNIDVTLVRKNLQDTNIPNYPKFKENKLLIFSKFENLINQLSIEERNTFYKNHYWSLLKCAIESTNKEYIKEAYNNYKHYDNPTWKLKLKCMFPKLYKRFNKD